MALEASLGTAATYGKEEVSRGPEHLVVRMTCHRLGRGDDGVETIGSAWTGPVGPLMARGAVAFSRAWR
jgi:hypothetical protein